MENNYDKNEIEKIDKERLKARSNVKEKLKKK